MKTPFAESEGILYVAIKASGIHPLIPFMDGLKISRFGKSKVTYLRLDDAIAWHKKELTQTQGECGNKKVLTLLERAKQDLSE